MLEPSSKVQQWPVYLSLLLLAVGCLMAIYANGQSDILRIYGGYGIASLGFAIYYRYDGPIPWISVITVGIIIRLASLGQMPQLSDDIYRFVWDGRLLHQGISPYAHLPSSIAEHGIPELGSSLFDLLNSPDYYSIYPPMSQVMYYLSTWPGMSVSTSATTLQVIHLAVEVGGIYLLYRLLLTIGKDVTTTQRYTSLYYLFPLVIIEGVGNLHHEIITGTCVIAALYCLAQRRYVLMALPIALGVGVKLIPLLLIPYLVLRFTKTDAIRFLVIMLGLGILMLAPIIQTLDFDNFAASLDLYFRRFEYNASIYYVLRWIGKMTTGYNLIAYLGPLLGLITVVFAIRLAYLDRHRDITVQGTARYMLYCLTVHYLCATTVHPWYIINLLPLALIAGHRYPFVWALLIPMTYINYSYNPYHENLPVVFLEYSLLLSFMIWEWAKIGKGATVAVR